MLTWQAGGGRTLESARVLLGAGGLRALGRAVRAVPGGPMFTSSYRLVVGESGEVQRLSLTTASAERERSLTLNRTEDGYWLLDTGSGGARAEFEKSVDVDVEHSPLFNALPIRRLGLHKKPGEHELPMVIVSVPTLEVRVVHQIYRTVSTLDGAGRAVVEFTQDGFSAALTVDADGMVLDYPGLASRL
ncbi:MAG TPA: putative glycolipid-binding domain-containing protein [Pseudonocardia sp.]|jgi:hypothetical protein